MPRGEHVCTLACIEQRDAEFVFVSNGTTYRIQNQDFADLPRLAGAPVELKGRATQGGIVVLQLTKVKR